MARPLRLIVAALLLLHLAGMASAAEALCPDRDACGTADATNLLQTDVVHGTGRTAHAMGGMADGPDVPPATKPEVRVQTGSQGKPPMSVLQTGGVDQTTIWSSKWWISMFQASFRQWSSKVDINGNPCMLCGNPLPGRGYDGVAHKSSELPSDVDLATLHAAGDYVIRDDCGNYPMSPSHMFTKKLSDFIRNTSTSGANAYPGYTNAWCETNLQVVSANAVANRDPLFQAKTLDVPRKFSYDFFYCKLNGWLTKEAREAVASGFEAASAYSKKFCAEKEAQFGHGYIEDMTAAKMAASYLPGMARAVPQPTQEEADVLGAWNCAMGGSDGMKGGQSNGCFADLGHCSYTYGDLGDGKFCVYDDCAGWDPKTGMPIADMATKAQ